MAFAGAASRLELREGKWNKCCSCLFSAVPDSLIVDKVFSYLSIADRLRASCTCTRFNYLAEDPRLWKNVEGAPASGVGLARLINRQRNVVEALKLSRSRATSDEDAAALKHLRLSSLQRLDLSGSSCSPAVTDSLVAFVQAQGSSLRHLILDGLEGLQDSHVASIVRHCPYLETLSLANCRELTDAALEALALSPLSARLTHLNISGCEGMHANRGLVAVLKASTAALRRATEQRKLKQKAAMSPSPAFSLSPCSIAAPATTTRAGAAAESPSHAACPCKSSSAASPSCAASSSAAPSAGEDKAGCDTTSLSASAWLSTTNATPLSVAQLVAPTIVTSSAGEAGGGSDHGAVANAAAGEEERELQPAYTGLRQLFFRGLQGISDAVLARVALHAAAGAQAAGGVPSLQQLDCGSSDSFGLPSPAAPSASPAEALEQLQALLQLDQQDTAALEGLLEALNGSSPAVFPSVYKTRASASTACKHRPALLAVEDLSSSAVTGAGLLLIASACGPSLQLLRMQGHSAVGDCQLARVLSRMPGLQIVDLRGCRAVSSCTIAALAQQAAQGEQLRELRLFGCRLLTDADMLLLHPLRSLQLLDLYGLRLLSCSALSQLAHALTGEGQLKTLLLGGIPAVRAALQLRQGRQQLQKEQQQQLLLQRKGRSEAEASAATAGAGDGSDCSKAAAADAPGAADAAASYPSVAEELVALFPLGLEVKMF